MTAVVVVVVDDEAVVVAVAVMVVGCQQRKIHGIVYQMFAD